MDSRRAVSLAVGVFVLAVVARWSYGLINCRYNECCEPGWISFNRSGLEADLKHKVFGQHIASRIILKAVTGFMNNDNRNKPLVLSLHGPTGTGKNFISDLIAKNIYKKGMKSKFVHLFNAEHHFSHASLIDTYKSQLRQWIRGNVTVDKMDNMPSGLIYSMLDGVYMKAIPFFLSWLTATATGCPTSMFIFDEMDKMPPGLIDSITSFLNYYDNLDGVSYRRAIFIFLSNAGGDSIEQTALHFWRLGRDRGQIELKDLEDNLSLAVSNNKQSGYANLIDKNLVDFFVPFLPLEYSHVVLCVKADMAANGQVPDQEVADKVAKDLNYFPKEERAFSVKGCKTLQTKLDYYL